MNTIRDEVFYNRQLELANELADVLGNEIKEINTTEYLYPWEGPFDKMLSYIGFTKMNFGIQWNQKDLIGICEPKKRNS